MGRGLGGIRTLYHLRGWGPSKSPECDEDQGCGQGQGWVRTEGVKVKESRRVWECGHICNLVCSKLYLCPNILVQLENNQKTEIV